MNDELNQVLNEYDAFKDAACRKLIFLSAIENQGKHTGQKAFFATLLNELGSLYRARSRFAESEKYFLRRLIYWENNLGNKHPDYATALNNLAGFYRLTGDCVKSDAMFELTTDIYRVSLGRSFSVCKRAQ